MRGRVRIISLLSVLLICRAALSAGTVIEFTDPKGDDKGPGNFTYPTDPIYVAGSFDLTSATIEDKGEEIEFTVKCNAPITFQWGDYWDVQQIQIYLDFDKVAGSGRTETITGTSVAIDPANAWEKVIFIDPHTVPKINGEIDLKAAHMKKDIILPSKIKPIGKSLKATVKKADLGIANDVDINNWGYGILMLSATGFPMSWQALMRNVNEFDAQHRFGGGSDGAGDPNVMDMFVDDANGSEDEIAIQYDQLDDWVSGPDPEDTSGDKFTVIKLVYPKK